MGWSGIKNGELLRRAAQKFDAFVTVDQGLAYQQNLVAAKMVVVVMGAQTNDVDDLQPLIPRVQIALRNASPGDVVRILA